ncbi:tetratricopeptide repeat protein [Imperialibacter roseus]|uniref:Tetratricopeptide repeat protein n=1 Tax=Imperialibacter roseus TaxID=1324217 RepID=A0ABZ0IW94_9BACT|nr:tetratricopeptide repeat protein [Imperialibacter roseus]WOK09318.1 tetratricopeptide repeat protein [Imperialibacter roseus]
MQNRKQSEEIANKFYQSGLQLQRSGHFIESTSAFDSSVHYNPQVADVYFSQGSSYEAIDDFARALYAYEKAIDLQPVFEGALFRRAVCLYKLNLHEDCIAQLNSLIASNGSSEETKAIFYRYSPSGEVNITADNQLNAEYYLYRGLAFAALQQEQAGMRDLDSAVSISGGASDYLVNRGLALQKLGRESKAIADYEAALVKNPDNQTALINLFTLDAARARKYLKKNENIVTEIMVPELLAQMGFDAHNREQYDEAINYYSRALEIVPSDPDWLMNRAICYGKVGLLEKAEDELLRVVSLSGFSEKAYLHLANILFLEEKYEDAISFYNLYLAIDINYGTAYFNRGIALSKTGETDEACKDLMKAGRLGVKEAVKPIESICNN